MVNSIQKCLKEWNATVEALGQGKQTILIRTYNTYLKEFLLNPTVSYALKDDYINSFKPEFKSFVKENSFPKKEGKKTEIKYFAKVEKIIEKPANRIGSIQKQYIWTPEHVKSYLKNQKAKIWLLRVYKLKKPYMAEPTPGAILYANLKEEVSLEGIKPVLSDEEFLGILNSM